MKAIRPVFITPIDEPTVDLNMGQGQAEYNTLPTTAIRRTDKGSVDYFVTVSRWKLTDDERASIYHGGADIVHQVIHTIGAYPPMNIQICDPDSNPEVVR